MPHGKKGCRQVEALQPCGPCPEPIGPREPYCGKQEATLFSDPVFLRGFLSPFVVRVPIVQMAILAGFVDTINRVE